MNSDIEAVIDFFGLSVNTEVSEVVIRRMVALAAMVSDNIPDDIAKKIEKIGSINPKNSVSRCFGVFYKGDAPECSVCSAHATCKEKFLNLGLGEVRISPFFPVSSIIREPCIVIGGVGKSGINLDKVSDIHVVLSSLEDDYDKWEVSRKGFMFGIIGSKNDRIPLVLFEAVSKKLVCIEDYKGIHGVDDKGYILDLDLENVTRIMDILASRSLGI